MRKPGLARMLWFLVAVAMVASAFSSCSPRYNIYFNGDTHYKETLKEMEESYADDYSDLLYIHPAEAHSNPKAPQPKGNFDRSIEKAQKAIQLRSIKKKPRKQPGKQSSPAYREWMKREVSQRRFSRFGFHILLYLAPLFVASQNSCGGPSVGGALISGHGLAFRGRNHHQPHQTRH